MPFGQHPGVPASQRQVRDLLALLEAAGHQGFRDARGPMGFTQRQAAGKFTRGEADAFLAALEAAAGDAAAPDHEVPTVLGHVSDDDLATELRRRGWQAVPPTP